MSEDTFDFSNSDKVTKGTYFPLRFSDSNPSTRLLREISIAILNYYGDKKLSKNKWLKVKDFQVIWKDEKGRKTRSKPLSYNIVHDSLKSKRKFDASEFNLRPMMCNWLDASVGIWPKFCAPCNQNDSAMTITLKPTMGSNFPILPALDREGAGFSSMQLYLQKFLIKSRTSLVEQSELFFESFDDWFERLLTYVNTSISLFDNTFHQMYNKAKYDHQVMGWVFDENKLGNPNGRRFTDKIKWIGLITGNPLDNAEPQRSKVIQLKNVRNHLNHFDPPVFVFSLEDATVWLNYIFDTAELIKKIREKLNSPLSAQLIEILLAPKVEFVPFDPGKRRPKQPQDVGYSSCIWPD